MHMKLKFTGEAEATLRHMTFTPGKAATFNMDDPADASLYDKCKVLPEFTAVKARKAKSDDQDDA